MIEEMPADMLNPLPAGYVLLDARKDRPLRAWAAHLEFRGWPDEQSEATDLLDRPSTTQ